MRAALKREDGQALTEYALVIALLGLVAVAVAAATGIGQTILDQISNQLGNVV